MDVRSDHGCGVLAGSLGFAALAASAAFAAFAAHASDDPAPPAASVRTIDLSKPFRARSPWRLKITQGPPTTDYGDNPAPGEIGLCLETSVSGPCDPKPVTYLPNDFADWPPHYLEAVNPVHQDGLPLLDVVTASQHAGDGGQVKVTQVLTYDKATDAFTRIYAHATGTNNNEEVRFVADGPLRGAVISAEPTADAPYAYWIVVNRLTPTRTYRQILRFRSATTYGDGNRLAVIDSEMPNILARLGLWKPGSAPPLPTNTACRKPHLKRSALWCD